MVEFDLLLYRLKGIVRDNLYCEDDKLYCKNKLKYEIVNLLEEVDKDWLDELYEDLEYNESEEE